MTAEAAAPLGRVHVIGAGIAGLAAAVDLAGSGIPVVVYESGAHAGGRCRSFLDAELGVRIDNGNHLLLSGNTAAMDYIDRIGARDTFERPAEAAIPFVDLASGERWAVRPSRGRIPWWLLRASRRIPGTSAADYVAAALQLWRAAPDATIAAVLPSETVLFRRLWQPLAVAALNTGAADGAARLLWRVIVDTLGRGAAACRPIVARDGLSESLVDPAVAFVERHGGAVHYGARLRAFDFADDRVVALRFDGETVALAPHDAAILAVPAAVAARLVPGLAVPDDHAPIVNAHYRYKLPADAPRLAGIVGGTAEWVFRKREVVSVTISAADRLVDRAADELCAVLWQDVAGAFGLPREPVPPGRIVKERRATFRATPAQLRRRPAAATRWHNFHLAGDYVETGLPATIEGAIRSGFAAAGRIGQRRSSLAPANAEPPVLPRPRHDRGLPARAAAMTSGTTARTKDPPTPGPTPPQAGIDAAIERAVASLLSLQHEDGYWVFELEADATIPAEYILLQHYLDTIDAELEPRIARYLRDAQGADGGWPLFYGGAMDLSASVKAYFALKAAGDDPGLPHMARARAAILANGGARHCNVFTRIMLALWGEVPWRAVPVMPVEIMLLPGWFPFHIDKISYWSRTVLVPLLVLMALRPTARNPRRVTIGELFVEPPESVRDWISPPSTSPVGHAFAVLDRLLRLAEPLFPADPRRRAIDKAVAFVSERLNGEDGLGGIFPAIANSLMMFDCLGYPADHPNRVLPAAALRNLVVLDGERGYCQPCVSPVWDSALACHALMEVGDRRLDAAVGRAVEWLASKQVLDVAGDWAATRPGVRPGGWAFQYANPHYPDLDDTAAVALALSRFDGNRYREAIDRAAEWVIGMQSRNGGWGSFDADNTHYYLNHIPFADHGALLDPPTADVTARCAGLLAQLGMSSEHPTLAPALAFLRNEQEADGSWFGRWGTNFIYGTWSVLAALNAAGMSPQATEMRRAVAWLLEHQRSDGGWGEPGESYWPDEPRGEAPYSTASQTAWALLGLMAAGEVDNPAVARGIAYLIASQDHGGNWVEPWFTAVGFPRVFYLRYHGYRAFFPLWALARYRRLLSANSRQVTFGL
jgi:squalene-hopene/tetraprenyl-beta-curcumene cyclase